MMTNLVLIDTKTLVAKQYINKEHIESAQLEITEKTNMEKLYAGIESFRVSEPTIVTTA